MFDWGDGFQLIQYFNHYINVLKRLPILIIFYHGVLNDYLMKVLNLFLHLITVLLQQLTIMAMT